MTTIFSNFLNTNSFKKGVIQRNTEKKITFYKNISVSLATIGFIETIYLTFSKLNGSLLSCSNQNCSIVLSSVFSNFLGIPISSIGVFLYLITGIQLYRYYQKNVASKENDLLLFISTTTPLQLSFFSLYFVFILTRILKVACPWCYFSIFLSGS